MGANAADRGVSVFLKLNIDPTVSTCTLSIWSVVEDETFCHALAAIYLRRPTHARKIIEELQPGPMIFGGLEIKNAIELLHVETADIADALASGDPKISAAAGKTLEARVSHRDGLLFQHVSWVAGTLQHPAAKAKAPHVRVAEKGFDGLFLEVANGHFTKLILCEDKATVNPRNTVVGKVWPELLSTESGEKDLELVDAVTALLDTMMPENDRVAVIDGAIWGQLRQYRVAVTAAPKDTRAGGYGHIFEGFESKTLIPNTTRFGEVMPFDDIRSQLQVLADKIILRLRQIANV